MPSFKNWMQMYLKCIVGHAIYNILIHLSTNIERYHNRCDNFLFNVTNIQILNTIILCVCMCFCVHVNLVYYAYLGNY